MAGDTQITVVGNLVDDPELRFTPSGAAVANFRIASTPRTFDKQANEWKDGEALFLSCSVWRQAAENVAGLAKGMGRGAGQLRSRQYETREGEKRTVFEIQVDEVGPSPKHAAKVTRNSGRGPVVAASKAAAGRSLRHQGHPGSARRRSGRWNGQPPAARHQRPWATLGVRHRRAALLSGPPDRWSRAALRRHETEDATTE
jgi:single-strand DNA-binding protein